MSPACLAVATASWSLRRSFSKSSWKALRSAWLKKIPRNHVSISVTEINSWWKTKSVEVTPTSFYEIIKMSYLLNFLYWGGTHILRRLNFCFPFVSKKRGGGGVEKSCYLNPKKCNNCATKYDVTKFPSPNTKNFNIQITICFWSPS